MKKNRSFFFENKTTENNSEEKSKPVQEGLSGVESDAARKYSASVVAASLLFFSKNKAPKTEAMVLSEKSKTEVETLGELHGRS
jgi:hypothetical protein